MLHDRNPIWTVLICVCLTSALIGGAWSANGEAAGALGPPFIALNGQVLSPENSLPILAAGEILLAASDLFTAIGGEVTPDAALERFTITRGDVVIELELDQGTFTLGDREMGFAIPPFRVGDVVYVDVRDLVTALGGQYHWDPATMTGDLRIQVVGAEENVVAGTLVHFDPATPPFFFLKAQDSDRAIQYTGAARIRYYRMRMDGVLQPASLRDLQAGDRVELTMDEAGKVAKLVISLNLVHGAVDWLGEGLIVLRDRSFYYVSANVDVKAADGRQYDLASLRGGEEVTLAVNPNDRTVYRIIVGAITPPEQPGAPRITSAEPESTQPVRAGQRVAVRLRGTAGGQASFDIGAVIRDIPLREGARGDYRGHYTVRRGDNAVAVPIVGHLRVNAQDAPAVDSKALVTIDTGNPVIATITPRDQQTINNASPLIELTYNDGDGSGIDDTKVTMKLDGRDLTRDRDTFISERAASHQARDLEPRAHFVDVKIADKAGNEEKLRFQFTVAGAGANKVTSVQHEPRRALMTGDRLTVTMEVEEPGKKASFVIGDDWREVGMTRIGATNRYQGHYNVRARDEIRNARIIGRFVDRHGAEYSMADPVRVNISAALPDRLAITKPENNAQIKTDTVEIEGLAPPGRKVRVAVQYTFLFGTKTLHRSTVTSDAKGRWKTGKIKLREGILEAFFASRFNVTAQLLDRDDNPEQTQQMTFEIAQE